MFVVLVLVRSLVMIMILLKFISSKTILLSLVAKLPQRPLDRVFLMTSSFLTCITISLSTIVVICLLPFLQIHDLSRYFFCSPFSPLLFPFSPSLEKG